MSGVAPPVIWVRVQAGQPREENSPSPQDRKVMSPVCTASTYKIRIKLRSYDLSPMLLLSHYSAPGTFSASGELTWALEASLRTCMAPTSPRDLSLLTVGSSSPETGRQVIPTIL